MTEDKTTAGDRSMTNNRRMTDKAPVRAGSKFSGLMAAVKDRQEDAIEPEEAGQKADDMPIESISATINVSSVRRGRPRGKRSSEDFVQVTAYIGRDTHRGVKIALLSAGDGREFSELVEDLLAEWLKRPR